MTNDEVTAGVHFRHSCFVIDSCIRHSSFVIQPASRINNAIHPLSLASALRFGPTDEALGLRSIGPYDARIVVPDFFDLVNVPNTGAAFGSFKGNNTFFVVISIIAMVVVTVLLVRHRRSDPWRDISLALLLAGIWEI